MHLPNASAGLASLRIAFSILAAAALLGCALETGRAPGESTRSGSDDLTVTPTATAAVSAAGQAQLAIQSGGAAPPFDVGGVVVGSTVVRLLTVTNTGTVASGALSMVALSGATDFAIVGGPIPCEGVKLAPAQRCDVVVTYAPTAAARADAAMLTVSDGTAKATAALTGLGITTGVDYVVDPDPGNLALKPGESGHLTFTVLNAGTVAGPAITRIGTDGDGATYAWFHLANDGCTKNPGLGVLASCTFDVDVTVPASTSVTSSTYYLSVLGAGTVGPGNANATYSTAVLTLPTPPAAVDYVLSPSTSTLSIAPGGSGHVTYTVTNKGAQKGPSVTGLGLDANAWFSRKTDTCTGNAGLAAGGTCTFDINVAVPASTAAQTTEATVLVSAGGALDPAGDTQVYSVLQVTVP